MYPKNVNDALPSEVRIYMGWRMCIFPAPLADSCPLAPVSHGSAIGELRKVNGSGQVGDKGQI